MITPRRILMPGVILASMAGAQDVWVARAPQPSSQQIESIACSPKRCLAASGEGALIETSDGKTWNQVQGVPRSFFWKTLDWSSSGFVAVGMYGWGISKDGIHWDFQELNMAKQSWLLAGGGWTGREFLLIGERDSALTSTDGQVWKADSFRCSQSSLLSGRFARGNGRVAVGFYNGTGCASGDSGRTWSEVTDSVGGGFGGFRAIGFNGDQFVAMALDMIWASSDGIKWTMQLDGRSVFAQALLSDTLRDVVIGRELGTGRNVIWNRPHGGSWGLVDTFDQAFRLREIGRADWGYVALGEAGHSLVSVDGIHWTGAIPDGDLQAVVHSDAAFYAVGRAGRLLRSTDGASWAKIALTSRVDLWDIATDGKRLVVVGDSGKAWASMDGSSWSVMPNGTTNALRSVVWAGNRFVAVGDSGTMIESTDGSSWKASGFSEQVGLVRIVAQGDILFVLDSDGKVWSRSGTQWSQTGPSSRVVALGAHAPDGLVAGDDNGGIWSSPDGKSWKRPSIFGGPSGGFYHTGKEWLAITSWVTSSADGVNWTDRSSDLVGAQAITSDGKTLVAVGTNGRIWTSEEKPQVSLKAKSLRATSLGLRSSGGTLSVQPGSSGSLDLVVRDLSGRDLMSGRFESQLGQELTVNLPRVSRLLVATVRQGASNVSLVILPASR